MLQTVFCLRRATLWMAMGLLSLLVCGCGDNDDGDGIGSDPNPTNLTYVGRYLGTSNLSEGQFAIVDLTTTASGAASGTLQMAIPAPVPILQAVGDGTNTGSGTVNLSTGSFTLRGSLGLDPFSVEGNLPAGNALGSFLITVNGQTSNGAIQNAILGTPPPPGGGGGSSDTDIVLGGALSNLVFTPGPGYNGSNPPVSSSSTITGSVTQSSIHENEVSISVSEGISTGVLAKVRTLNFGLALPPGEPLSVGQSYPLAANRESPGAFVSLIETTGPNGGGPGPIPLQTTAPISIDRAWAPIASTTGSVTVTRLTGSAIELDFEFVNIGPSSEIPGNQATGTFSISGHVLGNFAP